MADEATYKLELTGKGMKIDRTIPEPLALQIISMVMGGGMTGAPAGDGAVSTGGNIGQLHAVGTDTPNGGMTPKVFMSQKRPNTDSERITCLAYFASKYRNIAQFKTDVLTKLNTEAAGHPFSNASYFARDAVTQGYLSPAGGGKKQITMRGEAIVEALPDRNRVKAALEAHPQRKRKAKRAKKKR